jgi:hypothetical protein
MHQHNWKLGPKFRSTARLFPDGGKGEEKGIIPNVFVEQFERKIPADFRFGHPKKCAESPKSASVFLEETAR